MALRDSLFGFFHGGDEEALSLRVQLSFDNHQLVDEVGFLQSPHLSFEG